MKIFYTDIISGEGYDLYLDRLTDKEYLCQDCDIWETLNAGETKIKTLSRTDTVIMIKRED